MRICALFLRYSLGPVLLLLTLVTTLRAQSTYAIQVNPHLLPPYSAYLSDYYSGTRDKLTITLINRDQFQATLTVRLRMTITAPGGVRLQTNDNAYIPPVDVEPGMPLRLTQEDLAPYFITDNLITTGALTGGKLPEGMVEFCFQAIDAYTGRPLSASACARAFITAQKPPLLSLPLNNENIAFREPLNVLFQWTPLHQGLANVEYEFILKELWDNGMAVQAAFAYSPEIYRETTRSTSLSYGAAQPALLPGKRYAWCIHVQARDGMEPLNVFQNDGYTEVRVFSLQDNCVAPALVNAVAERRTLQLDWPALPEHIGFTVSYRLKTTDGSTEPWKDIQTLEPTTTFGGLQSGSVYEYRVGAYCIAGQPIYTPILEATVPAADSARLAQCGIMGDVNLANKEPLKDLRAGEKFMANDYPVTVTQVSGTNGVYTGKGWTMVPWLNDAKIAVAFDGITVNTDRQMIDGYVEAQYDKKESQIANLDEIFEGGQDAGAVKTGITKVDYTFDFSIPGVTAFTLDDDGDLIVTDDNGEPHAVTQSDNSGQGNEGNKVVVFPMTIKDKDGKVYNVEKETETDPATGTTKEVAKATYIGQQRAPLAASSFNPLQLDADKAMVTFERGTGVYAFDTWKDYYANVSLIKDEYGKALWTGYRAGYKFLPVGGSDVVYARIDIKDPSTIKADKILFITPQGTEFKATPVDNNTYKLTVTAGPVKDGQEVYALYPKTASTYYTLGKMVVVTYPAQSQKVVLVSVNNAPVDEQAIRDELRAVYGPVAVTWTVSKQAFSYKQEEHLMAERTGLSTYNDAMRALNSAFKAAPGINFDASANYLFFLKATGTTPNDRDYTGFMPRGAQFGYIFTSEIAAPNVPVTVAHELGHGRWKLYHTFDSHYGGYNRNETDNVMDYNNGSALAKWQWDILSDPAMLVSVFESDNASAIVSDPLIIDAIWTDDTGKETKIFMYGQKQLHLLIKGKQELAGKSVRLMVYSIVPLTQGKEHLIYNKLFTTRSASSVWSFDYTVDMFADVGGENQFLVCKLFIDGDLHFEGYAKQLRTSIVVFLPGVMRAFNWPNAVAVQEKWFKETAIINSWNNPAPKVNYLQLSWILSAPRIKAVFDDAVKTKFWTEKAKLEVKKQVNAMIKDGLITAPDKLHPVVNFDITTKGHDKVVSKMVKKEEEEGLVPEAMPMFEKYYYQNVPYKEPDGAPLDDHYGTIANCSIHLSVAGGTLQYDAKTGETSFTMTKFFAYIKDSFDFTEAHWYSQPLGSWNIKTNSLRGSLKENEGFTYVKNASYRFYREYSGMGADFYWYSTPQLYNVSAPQAIEVMREAQTPWDVVK